MKWFPYVSVVLFVSSMFLPGIVDDKGTMLGYEALSIGWLGTFGFILAWWGNVFGPIAFIFAMFKKNKASLILSSIAIVLALQSYSLTGYPANEGGVGPAVEVHYLGIGFYAWLLSFVLLFIYCAVQIRDKEKILHQ